MFNSFKPGVNVCNAMCDSKVCEDSVLVVGSTIVYHTLADVSSLKCPQVVIMTFEEPLLHYSSCKTIAHHSSTNPANLGPVTNEVHKDCIRYLERRGHP